MRLFIAIPLEAQLSAALARAQERLLKAVPEGIAPASLVQVHLTLLFIGERPPSDLPNLQAALADLSITISPFALRLTRLDAFPSSDDPRIVWAGAEDDSGQMEQTALRLRDIARALGFSIDTQQFRPHLTLARNKQVRNRTSLRLFIQREKLPTLAQTVNRIVLYQSTPTPTGHHYEELKSFTLGCSAEA